MAWELSPEEMEKIKGVMMRKAAIAYLRLDHWDIGYYLDCMWDALPDALQTYDPGKGAKLTTWILVKMSWALIEERRRRLTFSLLEDHRGWENEEDASDSVGDHLLTYTPDFDRAIFWESIVSHLPGKTQEVVRLLLCGYTVPEAACELGIKESAAYVRLFNARKVLRSKGISPHEHYHPSHGISPTPS